MSHTETVKITNISPYDQVVAECPRGCDYEFYIGPRCLPYLAGACQSIRRDYEGRLITIEFCSDLQMVTEANIVPIP